MLVVGRGPLQRTLLDSVGGDAVTLGAELRSFAERDGGVELRFADGRSVETDVLVGADGLRSTVRSQLLGDGGPRWSGLVAWRAAVELPAELVQQVPQGEYWADGRLFGCLHMGRGRVYWFAGWRTDPDPPQDPEADRREMMEAFAGWGPPLSRFVELTPASEILRNALYDRPPARRWSSGRATLVGDAAHPMLPNIGQGACQALEDAVVLADELAASGDVRRALKRYEQRRRRRSAAVVRQSRQMARMAAVRGAFAERARNVLMRATPEAAARRRIEATVSAG
jgi:2-polyprenyl-6-methoxyphenol hydroxylase-like FAD-dependent oxidoreductase